MAFLGWKAATESTAARLRAEAAASTTAETAARAPLRTRAYTAMTLPTPPLASWTNRVVRYSEESGALV